MKNSIIKNTKARVLPLTVVMLMVGAGIGGTFMMFTPQHGVVRGLLTSNFSSYKNITLDHNQVPVDQSNFPVLINLSSDADLASDCLDSGWDIAFFDGSDNQLNHQIELFDGDTGQLAVWVNVTSLSSSSDTTIYMYYNYASIGSSAENTTGVWHSDFVGVWLMDDEDNYANDSTSYGNDGTETGTPTYREHDNNIIGYGISLEGLDNGFLLPSDLDLTDATPGSFVNIEQITVIGRANLSNFEEAESKENEVLINLFGYYILGLQYDYDDDCIETYTRSSAGSNYWCNESEWVDNDRYHTYTFAYNKDLAGNEEKGYRNATLVSETTVTDIEREGTQDNSIGIKYNLNQGSWNGTIDYIWLIDGYRDADWITTHANNIMNSTDGGFFSIGDATTNVDGTYEISGLNVDTRFTHQGEPGDTNTSLLVMSIYSNTSGTSDNCTDIFLDFSGGYPSGYTAGNFSFQIRNTTDGTFTTNWATVTGNMTINSTTWTNNWAYGTDPFPITDYNSTLEVRMRVNIPNSATYGTNTTDAWYVKWKID